ncbi:hypothetical protein G3578_11340 [Brevibacillus sp. SYP-B805]|uniref:hypothetical protein n=1 Tax=Brevibacillus sp. SYP-B805 TaxID=1578199 RepID=UPI0013EC8E48|nr:hypothetical protein [Brevibacillus sp. SYP-B805]NGQ95748.1 hypothetical protein [Brevibacillus sp. SYP-B805]
MKKRELRKLLKQNPEFEAWLQKDPARLSELKANPASAQELFRRWSISRRMFDFDSITEKTKRAKDVLTNFQSILEVMSEYAKKEELF